MRLLIIILTTLSLTACASLWPFGKDNESGSCMDDDSCENANPFEEQLVGGTWYCYGINRDDWDCGQQKSADKIIAFSDPVPDPRPAPAEQELHRAEMDLRYESINHHVEQENVETPVEPSDYLHSVPGDLFSYPDDSYAVQLIALDSESEVLRFADNHAIKSPQYVRIKSQGSDWYVLLLEITDSRARAQRIADEWEAEHNPRSRPWVRPLGPLKRAVQSAAVGD